jgi:hypothetical protein
MAYFDKFPIVNYNGFDLSDFTLKVDVLTKVKNNIHAYSLYIIRDGERIEDVAFNLYGDVAFEWLIMATNDMTDPFYDWPMSQSELQTYISGKYVNPDAIHHYEINGVTVPQGTAGAIPITNSEYEEKINEEKREIKLLKPEYLSIVVSDFEEIMNNV